MLNKNATPHNQLKSEKVQCGETNYTNIEPQWLKSMFLKFFQTK